MPSCGPSWPRYGRREARLSAGGTGPGAGGLARLVVRPEARAELRAAARRYDRESPGLGGDFLSEVQRAFGSVAARPAAGAPLSAGRRRVLLRRFPYAIIYRELDVTRVRVLAVAHVRRRPGYWAARDRP